MLSQEKFSDVKQLNRLLDSQEHSRMKLVDRENINDSVSYLRCKGMTTEEVQQRLVQNFYVDLDLLNEALCEIQTIAQARKYTFRRPRFQVHQSMVASHAFAAR